LYGCGTWSIKLREERKLRVCENRVLRRIYGSKRDEATGGGENYRRSLMMCTAHSVLFGWSKCEERDGREMKHVRVREEVHTGFWWGNLRERDHLENPGVDRRKILRWTFRRWDGLDRSGSGQGQMLCSCKRGNKPSGLQKAGNYLTGWDPASFSRRTLLHGVSEIVWK